MKMIKSNAYGSLQETQLAVFEQQLGMPLPAAYRRFLLEHNGGKPEPSTFKISLEEGNGMIQVLFGLHSGPASSRLDQVRKTFRGRIPAELLAIARDPGGNMICIGLQDAYEGQIYFWDHESTGAPAVPGFENMTLLAPTFDAFLGGLFEEIDPEETELDRIVRMNDVAGLSSLLAGDFDLETVDPYDRSLLENAVLSNKPDLIRVLHAHGAKLQNARKIAEKNLRFFPEYQAVYDLLEQLYPQEFVS